MISSIRKSFSRIQQSKHLGKNSEFVNNFFKSLYLHRLSGFISINESGDQLSTTWPTLKTLIGVIQSTGVLIGWISYCILFTETKANRIIHVIELIWFIYFNINYAVYFMFWLSLLLKCGSIFDTFASWIKLEACLLRTDQKCQFKRMFHWMLSGQGVYIVGIACMSLASLFAEEMMFLKLYHNQGIWLSIRVLIGSTHSFAQLFYGILTFTLLYVIYSFKHMACCFTLNLSEAIDSQNYDVRDLANFRLHYVELNQLLRKINQVFGFFFFLIFSHVVTVTFCFIYGFSQFFAMGIIIMAMPGVCFNIILIFMICDVGNAIKCQVNIHYMLHVRTSN